MELHAPDREALVAQAHDLAFGGFGSDLEIAGEGGAFDEKRVVTGGGKTLRQTMEKIGVTVQNWRGFAVHQPARAHDPAAEVMTDGLVTQADTEDRLFAGEGADDVERDAGFPGRAGTGREEDTVGIERESLRRRDFIVPENPLLHAQLAEILDEVEGERVEIVDDEQHADTIAGLTAGSSVRVGWVPSMTATSFQLLKTDVATAARRGRLATRHGGVETPAFMPVGTQGTVKALTPSHLNSIGAQIILGNTYHLNLRPGSELIRELGGLHRFMGWDGPILTDSGGFQVFSLAKLRDIRDEGVAFQSHLDGTSLFLGPREVMVIQQNLDSDIAMVLDECPPWPCDRDACARACTRSLRWAAQCRQIATDSGFLGGGHHVFAIVQGSTFEDLRRAMAEELTALDFSGYAIGGVSVGEPEPEMLRQVAVTAPHLPAGRPRYTMGVGTPAQLLKMIALGVDLFDCVLPTRVARNGLVFTPDGPMNLRNEKFRADPRPVVEGLDNYTAGFSRAYLRHLIQAGEMLAGTLLTLHNLHFYLDLMTQARAHIEGGDFATWSRTWIERYEAGAEK